MSAWILVGVLLVATVAFKAAGPVLLTGRDLPPRARQVVSLLAPALLAGLIVSQTFNASHPGLTIDDRAAGLAVALLAALARLPMLAVIALAAVATAVTALIL
jgi:uncharacterized membrane protein